jgi:hypothetical protein
MMTMTKQHFESLAEALGMAVAVESIADEDDLAIVSTGAAYRVALAVADALRGTNPRFDRARFMGAVDSQIDRTAALFGENSRGVAIHAARRLANRQAGAMLALVEKSDGFRNLYRA